LGDGHKLEIVKEMNFPHSLGMLYSAFTYFTGFKVNSGEYKLMGLAPYGVPRFRDLILDELVDLKDDGSFRLNTRYFGFIDGLRMTNQHFAELFGATERKPESPLEQAHMDLAASVQAATEEIVLRLARHARDATGSRNLCLAGGVALNCVANGRLRREKIFDRIYVQPAAGDAGGALGAALAAYHIELGRERVIDGDKMRGSFLGPRFESSEVEQRLSEVGARFRKLAERHLLVECAQALAGGKAVGWFQGPMEFGPRALGARSILADPRSPQMQSQLNHKVKFRESFRPFAPAVLRERAADWFEIDGESPYMLFTSPVAESRRRQVLAEEESLFGIEKLRVPRSEIPAVTHVDYSARVQTVTKDTNPRFHALLSEFERQTGCPVLVNTSFNVRGEPIVGTPEDAFRCFMGTDLDLLVVEDCILKKEEQDTALRVDYRNMFQAD
jgi:carbamoyltransferase